MPMLRGKAAEYDALKALKPAIKDRLTPLIEIPAKEFDAEDPKTPRKLTERFKKHVKSIAESWGPRRLFLDLGHLPPSVRGTSGLHPVEVMWQEARLISLFPPTPVPVVKFACNSAYLSAVRSLISGTQEGYCLRLRWEELCSSEFEGRLEVLLNYFGFDPERVDLVLDFGLVDEGGFDLMSLCAALPHLQQWRTLTSVGGAFPIDLQGLEVGEHLHPRWEWRRYQDQVMTLPDLPRVPTFGDYTIQHPVYIEPVEGSRPSASVRYTCDRDTLIMRGEHPAKDGSGGFKQYPAHAVMLCDRGEFCGAEFSEGDAFIWGKAQAFEIIAEMDKGGTGGPRQWLYAGINHHMAKVTGQIDALFGS